MQALSHINIPNFLIVAIDTKLRDYLKEKGINCYYKDIQVCMSSNCSTPAYHCRAGNGFLVLLNTACKGLLCVR